MKAIVKINEKNTNKNISENVFESKKEAMDFIKSLTIESNQLVYGNFSKTGKNFYFGFSK